jgi:hypothetical protein
MTSRRSVEFWSSRRLGAGPCHVRSCRSRLARSWTKHIETPLMIDHSTPTVASARSPRNSIHDKSPRWLAFVGIGQRDQSPGVIGCFIVDLVYMPEDVR